MTRTLEKDPRVICLDAEYGDDAERYYNAELPLLKEVARAAAKEFHRQAMATTDTTGMDWDTVSSDELIDRLQEYQRYRKLEDGSNELLNWLETLPPF